MTQPTILVSPKGFDDANAVLQQLGGRLANTRQLQDSEAHYLGDIAFLKQFRHLFLNCHRMFDSADPNIVKAVRSFVEDGGVLYASDWASSVVEKAFGRLVTFSRTGGASGVVNAVVTDPYLAQVCGRSISINFDLDGWHSIDRLARNAEVYMWDRRRRPVAAGFSIQEGRVVYTSFHHHAQGGTGQAFSREEEEFLSWLVTLPTQHAPLRSVGQTLARHRAGSASTQVVSRVGPRPQIIPLHLGAKAGLGVCTLSWEQNEQLELSLAYLRRDEVLKINKSTRPPITLTVRDPQEEDSVKVSRRLLTEAPEQPEDAYPYAFGAALRRDLLGDSNWFALAVARHIQTLLRDNTSVSSAHERLTEKRIAEILRTILEGLGYVVEQRSEEGRQEVAAWSSPNNEESPDVQIEVQMVGTERVLTSPDEDRRRPALNLPIHHESLASSERLLARVSFSLENRIKYLEGEGKTIRVDAALVIGDWRLLASERLPLDHEEETVPAESSAMAHYLDIAVYRLDE